MMTPHWTQIVLALLLALFAYPFAIYPALLALTRRRGGQPAGEVPPGNVALIICALNEQSVIGDKIRNSLELDYPAGRLRIVVVSDGSTDRTAEIAREFLPGIELIERPERRGKVANLNEVIQSRSEEFIVLSDANVIYDSMAVRRLAERLSEPTVGAASGKVVLVDAAEEIGAPEQDYYSLEWMLQERESEIHSMVGADGAMYAFRRELFVPCPNDTIIEDFVIPIGIVRQGARVVFEPRALAWERGVSSLREEARRKIRIAAGAAQSLVRGNGWPKGAPPRFWWIFVSHKLLRWLSPLVGACALVLAAASWKHILSLTVLAGVVALLAAALARLLTGWRCKPLDGAFYFTFGQFMLAWGLVKGAVGQQSVLWEKRNR